jgi:hypothetical protein
MTDYNVDIVDPETGEIALQLWSNPKTNSCGARETGDLCGGCNSCLLMQAEHLGFLIVPRQTDGNS